MFSKIDLRFGYHQLKIAKADILKRISRARKKSEFERRLRIVLRTLREKQLYANLANASSSWIMCFSLVTLYRQKAQGWILRRLRPSLNGNPERVLLESIVSWA